MIANTHYGYVGKGGGVPKFTYTGNYNVRDDGVVELLTSGTLVFLNPAVIDRFMVGGGSSGVCPGNGAANNHGLGGGAGGYTRTDKKVEVAANQAIQVTIGKGGKSALASVGYCAAVAGGATSWDNVSVNGGSGVNGNTIKVFMPGCNGGSGGGGGVDSNSDYGSGGYDGNNGEQGYISSSYNPAGGTGQGNSTREFGESTGKLYAGGGGGGRWMAASTPVVSMGGTGGGGTGGWAYATSNKQSAAAGVANTGGGGGGGVDSSNNAYKIIGASGGSGIVCFRAAK